MSKYALETEDGKFVDMGFDRPTNSFFLNIFENEETIYMSLMSDAFCTDLDVFVNVLKENEVTVPEEMISEIQMDQNNNVGNKFVQYTQDGFRKETPIQQAG